MNKSLTTLPSGIDKNLALLHYRIEQFNNLIQYDTCSPRHQETIDTAWHELESHLNQLIPRFQALQDPNARLSFLEQLMNDFSPHAQSIKAKHRYQLISRVGIYRYYWHSPLCYSLQRLANAWDIPFIYSVKHTTLPNGATHPRGMQASHLFLISLLLIAPSMSLAPTQKLNEPAVPLLQQEFEQFLQAMDKLQRPSLHSATEPIPVDIIHHGFPDTTTLSKKQLQAITDNVGKVYEEFKRTNAFATEAKQPATSKTKKTTSTPPLPVHGILIGLLTLITLFIGAFFYKFRRKKAEETVVPIATPRSSISYLEEKLGSKIYATLSQTKNSITLTFFEEAIIHHNKRVATLEHIKQDIYAWLKPACQKNAINLAQGRQHLRIHILNPKAWQRYLKKSSAFSMTVSDKLTPLQTEINATANHLTKTLQHYTKPITLSATLEVTPAEKAYETLSKRQKRYANLLAQCAKSNINTANQKSLQTLKQKETNAMALEDDYKKLQQRKEKLSRHKAIFNQATQNLQEMADNLPCLSQHCVDHINNLLQYSEHAKSKQCELSLWQKHAEKLAPFITKQTILLKKITKQEEWIQEQNIRVKALCESLADTYQIACNCLEKLKHHHLQASTYTAPLGLTPPQQKRKANHNSYTTKLRLS